MKYHIVSFTFLVLGLLLSACVPPPLTTPPPSPAPTPTSWLCTSYRSGKVQKGDISGEVRIDFPLQGTLDLPANEAVQVSGTYTGLPAGKYLWIFVYSPDAGLYGRYYPQTKDAVQGWQPEPTTGQDGKWSLKIGLGAHNLCYEVIIMIGDTTASQSIANQLQEWSALGDYAGYELNGPLSTNSPDVPGLPDGIVEKASIEVMTK